MRSGLRRAALGALLCSHAGWALAQFVPVPYPGMSAGIVARPAAVAPGRTLQPGIRITETISDNPLYLPRGSERSGFLTEVAPSIIASTATTRAQGSLAYTLRGFYRNVEGETDAFARNDLRARGNLELIDGWAGVAASASIFDVNTNPFGVIQPDASLSTTNLSRIGTYTISPYVGNSAGSFAEYRLGYAYTSTQPSRGVANILAQTDQQFFGNIVSGSSFRNWTWAVTGSSQEREFENGLSLARASAIASLYYVFSPELRVAATANYARIERLFGSDGKDRGWGPGISLDWSPSRRTALRVAIADQYYGGSSSVRFSHRSQRWIFGLDYNSTILTSNTAGVVALDPGTLYAAGALPPELTAVFQQLVAQGVQPGSMTPIGAGVLNDAQVRNRSFTASLGYLLPRGALSLTMFQFTRETLLDSTLFVPEGDPLATTSFGKLTTKGGSLSARAAMSPTAGVSALLIVRNIEQLLPGLDETRLVSLILSADTRLTPRTFAALSFRHTTQTNQRGFTAAYEENAILGTLSLRY